MTIHSAWLKGIAAALLCGSLVMLASAQQQTGSIVPPPTHPEALPASDPLLHAPAQWTAVSKTAMGVTGDLLVRPRSVAMAGHTIPLAFLHTLAGAPLQQAAALFPVPVNSRLRGALYKVSVPATTSFMRRNTLCGKQRTTFFVLLTDGSDLQLAMFAGRNEPNLSANAVANSTEFCGTYSYAAATAAR